MKKRILAILIIALMLIPLIPSTAFAATSGKWGSNITWKISGSTLTISGKGAMKAPNENNIPPWFTVYGLEKIVINDGVTKLPDLIFMGCIDETGKQWGTARIESIVIPASVKEISQYAFWDCKRLHAIYVKPGNKYYSDNDGILYNKDQTELLWVPHRYGNRMTIPKTVEVIRVESLLDNAHLSWFNIEEGNTVFEIYDRSIYHKPTSTLFMVAKGANSRLEVKEGTKAIAGFAFYACYNVTEVDIPEGVGAIESVGFYGCESLHTIHLPSTITSIGEEAFGECPRLKDVYFNGTKEMWEKIAIAEGNENFLNANIRFACVRHTNLREYHPATCTEYQQLYCEDCTFVIDGDPPLGHSAVIAFPYTEPTCTNSGWTDQINCERCYIPLVNRDFIDPLGHDEIPVPAVEPTCTSTGLTEGKKCSRCDEIFVAQQVVPEADHTGEWTITKPATETEKGIKTRTCTVCGEVETVEYSLYKKGDVNKDGSVDAKDATQILRFVNGKASALDSMDEAERLAIGDVSRDDSIDAKDATQILRYVNGKTSMFDRSEQ